MTESLGKKEGGFLTYNEKSLIAHIGSGFSSVDTAKKTDRAAQTVRNGKTRLYTKLGVETDDEALTFLLDTGSVSNLANDFDLLRITLLQEREIDVYRLLTSRPDLTSSQIGAELKPPVKGKTVKNYTVNINRKLGTDSRLGIILFHHALTTAYRNEDFDYDFLGKNLPVEDQIGVTQQEIEVYRHSPDPDPTCQIPESQL